MYRDVRASIRDALRKLIMKNALPLLYSAAKGTQAGQRGVYSYMFVSCAESVGTAVLAILSVQHPSAAAKLNVLIRKPQRVSPPTGLQVTLSSIALDKRMRVPDAAFCWSNGHIILLLAGRGSPSADDW